MAKTSTTFQARYKSWKDNTSKEDRAPLVLIKRIKEAFFDAEGNESDEDYFRLLFFVRHRIPSRQNPLIKDISKKQNIDPLDSFVEITNDVYSMLKTDIGLKEKMLTLPEPDNYKCLFGAIRNILKQCRKKWLKQNYRKNEFSIDCGKDDKGQKFVYQPKTQSPFADKDLAHYELKNEAKALSQYLLQEWDDRQRNVLCEYYDYVNGNKSPRLTEVSKANLHKLHERMRDSVNDLVGKNICTELVFSLMLKHYLKEICQKTPVLATNKKVKQKT